MSETTEEMEFQVFADAIGLEARDPMFGNAQYIQFDSIAELEAGFELATEHGVRCRIKRTGVTGYEPCLVEGLF